MRATKSTCVPVFAVLAAILAAAPAHAQYREPVPDRARFRASFQVWRPDVTGFIEVVEQDLVEDPVDVEDRLGLTEAETGWLGDVAITMGRRHRLLGSFAVVDHSATRTVRQTFEFGGQEFLLTDEIASTLEFREGHGFYNFLAVVRPEAELGILVGGGYLELTATVRGTVGQVTTRAMAPAPLVGGNLRVNPDGRFVVYGEVSGFPEVSIEEFTASLLDIRGHVEIYLIENLAGVVGYRYYNIDFKDAQAVDLSLAWQGLTFGGMVRF